MMSAEQKAPGEIRAGREVEPPLKKRAVTLYAIIIFKLFKGSALHGAGPGDLPRGQQEPVRGLGQLPPPACYQGHI